jgi:hypothetical protein
LIAPGQCLLVIFESKEAMPRLHLWEIHEQSWCPDAVRNGATECLNIIANVGMQYQNVVPLLRQALDQSTAPRIVDLCSGSGGPWLTLHQRLNRPTERPVEILLTDLYPSVAALEKLTGGPVSSIRYHPTPVDATRLPDGLDGFRTLFTAFHHFPPPVARTLLQDAVDRRQGIAIFEQTRRSLSAVLLMFTLPWIALLVIPFIRPFRVARLFWTYLIPAIPFVLLIDGIVSCLRSYTPAELSTMVAQLDGAPYRWEIGRVASPLSPIGVTYAIGYPVEDDSGAATDGGDEETSPRVARIK